MRFLGLAPIAMACGDGVTPLGGGDPTNGASDCPSAEQFVVGMEKASAGGVTVTLADATPAPPYSGDNTWTVELAIDGVPVADALPVLTPFMPLHNHGLVPPDYVGAASEPGTYEIETFDLIMPGQWDFTVDLGGGDTVAYSFCVEG